MAKGVGAFSTFPFSKPIKHRDRGWSWIVLVASFCMQLLCDGTISSYGIVYAGASNDTQFRKANYTEGQLTLPGALQSCLYITAMGLASPLVNLLGFQWIACVGGLTAGLAMMAATFFTEIAGMVVFYGVLSGLGLGSVCLCAAVAVAYYFEHYRGLASGIAASGNGLGYIVVPLIINSLTGHFGTSAGWRQAVRVFSLILACVTFAGGLILRPLELEAPTLKELIDIEKVHNASNDHSKISRGGLETIREAEALEVRSRTENPPQLHQAPSTEIFASVPAICGSDLSSNISLGASQLWDLIKAQKHGAVKEMVAEEFEPGVLSDDRGDRAIHKSIPDHLGHRHLEPSYLHSTIYASKGAIAKPLDRPDSLFFSSLRILPHLDHSISTLNFDVSTRLQLLEKQSKFGENLLSTVSLTGTSLGENNQDAQPSLGHRLVRMFDLTLFCNFSFLILTTSFVVYQLAYFVPFVYFFTFALESGLTRSSAVLLISILGILHTFGRLAGGVLANFPRVNITIVTMVSCLLCSACHCALPSLPRDFNVLAVYSASFGFLCAVPCPLQPLLFIRFLGLSRLTMAVGNSSLIKGIAAAIGPIVAAYIKDSTESLNGTFYWCGGCFAMSGLLLLFLCVPRGSANGQKESVREALN